MLLDIVIFVVAILVGAGIGAGIGSVSYGVLKDYSINKRVKELEVIQESLINSIKGQKSVNVRNQYQEELENAMLEVGMALKEGKNLKEVLPAVASKYPNVAMKLAKKIGLGF
jgi:hypothetical protein